MYAIDRMLPDSGLWDGSDMYNIPLKMKRLFPNALGIFGFHRPSPFTPGGIWRSAFNQARLAAKTNNILVPLLSDSVSVEQKKMMVQKLRIGWTRASFALNRGRANGSITPAFPDLDQNGLFAYEPGAHELPGAPKFAPYEVGRGQEDREVVTVTTAATTDDEPKMQVVVIKAKRPVQKDEAALERKIQEIMNAPAEQPDEMPVKKLKDAQDSSVDEAQK